MSTTFNFSLRSPHGTMLVGDKQPCFIVAELSANHEQKYEQAVALVKAAATAGADAVKLQTYTADTMTINSNKPWFLVGGKNTPKSWKKETFYHLYQKANTPYEWHKPLQELATKLGLIFFSTAYDTTAVDFLETLNVPCYKIASYEATDLLLLKRVAKTKQPIILSTGFATLPEIELSVKTLKDAGVVDLALLHCTTSYSAKANEATTHLRTMADLHDRFKVVTGFSDNMGGVEAPALAAAMGASIIEKHLVLKHGKALDDRFSLDAKVFKTMVAAIREQEKLMGQVRYGARTPSEEYNRHFRRSLFVVTDIKKGEKFSVKNIRSIRPADGLEIKYYEDIIGRRAIRAIERGTPLAWNLIER